MRAAACVLRRDVCEGLVAAGVEVSLWGVVDQGVLVGEEGSRPLEGMSSTAREEGVEVGNWRVVE